MNASATPSHARAGAWAAAPGRVAFGAIALAALVALAYAPALSCGFIWDDDFYVSANPTLRSLEGLRRIWLEPGATPQYYPLVHTSYWLEYRLFGLAPAGYHAVNAALHAVGAILAGRVLLALGTPAAAAWLAAAVFALHPVHVESVAWITERKNVLSGACYLAALLVYLRFDAGARARAHLWALAFALYLGALLSKTVTSTLAPAILLLLWARRGRIGTRDVARLAPFFAAGLALGLVTIAMEKSVVGASGREWQLSALDRVLVAGRAFWFYLGKLAWPVDLAFVYPRWRIDSSDAWQWLYPLAALAALGLLFALRARIGRWPFAALAFFAGTLVPALGFFDVYPMRFSFVADHFQYLASLGPIALAAALAVGAAARLRAGGRRAAAGLAALLLLTLGLGVRAQLPAYRDLEALWSHTIDRNPEAWIAWNNLGQLVSRRGETERALELYRRAVELNPDYEMAHYNLGSVLADQGRLDEALPHLERAVALAPGFADGHNNLGNALGRRGDYTRAVAHYRAALAIDPRMAKVHLNLGIALRAQGDLDGAIASLERAVALRPRWARAQQELAAARRARESKARGRLSDAERLRHAAGGERER